MTNSKANDIIFYTHPTSRGNTVRWILEEIGQPYETKLLAYDTSMKESAFLAINPLGKVPALRHGKTVITESAAICAYLADALPEAKLAPACTDPLRGSYYRWLFFTAGPLEAGFINQALGVVVKEEQKRMVGYGDVTKMFSMVESVLSKGKYIVGEHFSAADIYLCSLLDAAMRFQKLPENQVLVEYVSRLKDRPAAIRAQKIDSALMAEMNINGNINVK